jgi:hypothetical protein
MSVVQFTLTVLFKLIEFLLFNSKALVRHTLVRVVPHQKSTDNDENNDRKKHGQTQFTNSEDRKLKTVNTKSEQKPDMKSCILGFIFNTPKYPLFTDTVSAEFRERSCSAMFFFQNKILVTMVQ